MSILPFPPCEPVQRGTRTVCSPLLHLLRMTLAERGEITLRLLPPDSEYGVGGCVMPHENVVALPDDQDDVQYLTTVVYALYQLATGHEDPRLEDSADWFVRVATRRTVAAMGEVAR